MVFYPLMFKHLINHHNDSLAVLVFNYELTKFAFTNYPNLIDIFPSADGVWSTEGCILDKNLSNANVSVCRCNHLTHFGILINVGEYQVRYQDIPFAKNLTSTYRAVDCMVLSACVVPGRALG
jgi:hypothetical protein